MVEHQGADIEPTAPTALLNEAMGDHAKPGRCILMAAGEELPLSSVSELQLSCATRPASDAVSANDAPRGVPSASAGPATKCISP